MNRTFLARLALLSWLAGAGCSGDESSKTGPAVVAGSGANAGALGPEIAGALATGGTLSNSGAGGAGGAPVGKPRGGGAGTATPEAGRSGGAAVSGSAGSVAGTNGSAGSGSPPSAGSSAMAGGGAASSSAGGAAAGQGGANGGGSAGTAATPPRRKKFVGNITTGGRVRPDFIEYWDQLTPENEGKWGSVERTRDQMNWGPLDAAYQYAKQQSIPFKQHTFVWGSQQPTWITGLSLAEQRAEVEEWIRLYCERYPDTQLIDVVNEPPPHTSPTYIAALGGAGTSGYDWIVQSFKWARQYCPDSILILNDYNTIEYANDNDHFIDIVKRIKAAGAPIDAVGVQAHAAYKLPTATVKMLLDKIASETALPVYVSEYDIDLSDDDRQKSVMESQLTMFWDNPNVEGITIWGYIEGQTWLANSGLMSSSGQMRPALTWLLEFLDP